VWALDPPAEQSSDRVMPHRDDLAAAHERIAALEAQNAELKSSVRAERDDAAAAEAWHERKAREAREDADQRAIDASASAKPSRTSPAGADEESSLARHFLALGVGVISGVLAFVVGFGVLATWNGALTRFEQRHAVLSIVLGTSVLFLGFGPAMIGARALVAPDQASGEYAHDATGQRIRVGTIQSRETTGSALKWLAFGWLYATGIGAVFFFGGR